MAENKSYEQLHKIFCELFETAFRTQKFSFTEFFERANTEFQNFGFRSNIKSDVENILILRLDVVGDFIVTSGFIREVRKNFPNAKITLVVSQLVRNIAEHCPYVDEVFNIQGSSSAFGKEPLEILVYSENFCFENLWSKHFQKVFCPQWGSDNLLTMLMAFMSGANERIGFGIYPYESYTGENQNKFTATIDSYSLTKKIITPQNILSEADKAFYMLENIGLKVTDRKLECWYTNADKSKADELLKDLPTDKQKILLGIGAGSENRKYPVKKYLIALKKIVKKDFVFVIVGGNAEKNDAEFLEKNLPVGTVFNFVGKTSLRETMAVISQMNFYIGNDTGVMHMAATLNIPLLAVYREAKDRENNFPGLFSEYKRFPPANTKAVVLRPEHALDDCAKRFDIYGVCCHEESHCITQITPKEIFKGFEKLQKM